MTFDANAYDAFLTKSRARAAANNDERPAALAERGLTGDGHGVVAQVLRGEVVQHIHVNGCWGECGVKVPRNVTPMVLSAASPRVIRTVPLAPCVGR